MPHLTLEYTANLADRAPDRALLLSLHRVLESVAGISIGNCKSRGREVDGWAVGDGAGKSAFVHLDIRLLEGRPEEVRKAVGARALDILRAHFTPPPEGAALQITVEVQEIVAAMYFKDPPGTLTPPTRVRFHAEGG